MFSDTNNIKMFDTASGDSFEFGNGQILLYSRSSSLGVQNTAHFEIKMILYEQISAKRILIEWVFLQLE